MVHLVQNAVTQTTLRAHLATASVLKHMDLDVFLQVQEYTCVTMENQFCVISPRTVIFFIFVLYEITQNLSSCQIIKGSYFTYFPDTYFSNEGIIHFGIQKKDATTKLDCFLTCGNLNNCQGVAWNPKSHVCEITTIIDLMYELDHTESKADWNLFIRPLGMYRIV